jgi:type IV secretory pathway TraG/TraD family ATPase VirD4
VTRSRLGLAAALVTAGGLSAQAANREAPASDHTYIVVAGVVLVFAAISFWRASNRFGLKRTLEKVLRIVLGIPLTWMVLSGVRELTGFPPNGLILPLWGLAVIVVLMARGALVPRPVRRLWASLFGAPALHTHGTAHFGTARDAARHLAPAAPEDAFVLGVLRDARRGADRRFRQDGHVLTCAPTGAGKGIGAVIPNLLEYPGSAFVLDFKGEIHAVTASARRALGHDVILIDPFGVAGAPTHTLNWLDTLNLENPDVISRAAGLADMLVIVDGAPGDSHWNDTARELLRGLLVHVAGLPGERRSMAELRRIVTAPEDDLAATLAEMMADPGRGHGVPARTAAAHLNRPERERGSVLSSVVRHTAWLDDPRLCSALGRSDFSFGDLKRRKMTVYLAIPPDRLRVCLGFVRGFIGLALDGVIDSPARPAHRVAFYLDEFGQLGRMDRLADSITLLRGYGAQLWVFVQDLSQLKAVYPRWQSFLANTSQQFFGTADYDTARYLSGALGQQTIRFQTEGSSESDSGIGKPGSTSTSIGEHFQGRPLLTPDEIMRLGPAKAIVLIAGEPPWLLDRVNYLTDPAYAGRFDPNPMHMPRAAE